MIVNSASVLLGLVAVAAAYTPYNPSTKKTTTTTVKKTTTTTPIKTTTTTVKPSPSPVLDMKQVLPLPYVNCATWNRKCYYMNTGFIFDAAGNYASWKDANVDKVDHGIKFNSPGGVTRGYIVNLDTNKYELFNLKNRQFSFDMNIAGVKCGYNAAAYFSQLPTNAFPGTGYCDGQNVCNEMDIVEANVAATAYTAHPCNATDQTGKCDPWGCGANTNTLIPDLVGPGKYIDTSKTVTVTTQFKTDTGFQDGELASIQQFWIQGKKVVGGPVLNKQYCDPITSWNPYWNSTGELPGLSRSYDIGQVFILSFWGDGTDSMSWLDGGHTNPRCNQTVGDNVATFQNIKLDFIQNLKDNRPATTTVAAPAPTTV